MAADMIENNDEFPSCEVRFPSTDRLAKLLNSNAKDFHRNIKPLIEKDTADKAAQIGTTNPTIGYDDKSGNIWLKNEKTGATIETEMKLDWYKNE